MASPVHLNSGAVVQPQKPLLNPQRRFRLESAALLALACIFILVSQQQQWFAALDRILYDGVVSNISAPQDSNTVIVAIDDNTLHQYGTWPWPRDLQAQLLQKINSYQPEHIALDIIYAGQTSEDSKLISAAEQVPILALPLIIESLGQGQQHIEVLPFSELLNETDVLGHVHVELDPDAIARGTHLYQGVGTAHWPHLMLALSQHRGVKGYPPCANGPPQSLFLAKCGYVKFAFAGDAGTYPQIAAHMLLNESKNQTLLSQALRGKTVLVGLTASGVGDWVTTPQSGDSGPMSGVEFNANLLSALINASIVSLAPDWFQILLGIIVITGCTLLLPRLRPKQMLTVTVGLALFPLALTTSALGLFWHHIPLVNATIAVILIYPLWSWRRHEIAWQFIDTELGRIDREQHEWTIASGGLSRSKEPTEILLQLGQLLQAELSVSKEDGYALKIDAERKKPLSVSEQDLLTAAATQMQNFEIGAPGLPGEVLAAQIQRLSHRAKEVRDGRAMGLAGLGRMSNGVIILSAFDEIRFMNDAAAHILEVDRHAITTRSEALAGLQPPLGQSWQDITRQVVLDETPVRFEGHSAQGTPLFVTAEPLKSDEKIGFAAFWVVTLADLSAIRAAQAQREEALAFLSHDIRSPLVSVLALIRGSDKQNELLRDIERYTQKGLATSEQFLQLSRLQMQGSFERYELALEQVIHNAVEQVYVLSRDAQVSFSYTGLLTEDDQDDVTWLQGNGELLERALVNLFGNAIKYSESGTTITLGLEVSHEQARITIKDQGYGIPAQELEHIFEPFFRSAEPRLANNRGAGLGLRFVKTVVERHQGNIQAHSVWGEGTQFTLTLPCLPELVD